MTATKELRNDTEALSLPAGRRVGQPGHQAALEYLEKRLTAIGLSPFKGDSFKLPFTGVDLPGRGLPFTNLAGLVHGTSAGRETLPKILIGAHYDSVIDAPCSDDNATAVAVALAVAKAVKKKPMDRDLLVVLFDSEEPPWFMGRDMGSNRFVADHGEGLELAGALIMDLIGHDIRDSRSPFISSIPRVKNLMFVLGLESHPSMPPAVKGAGRKGLTVLPTLNRYVADLSDHHAFRTAGYPFLFLTCAQGEHYHRPTDDMSRVNMRKVHRVYRYLLALTRSLDRTFQTDAPERDSIDFEVTAFRRSLGWLFPLFLRVFGLKRLESRQDMDQLAMRMSGLFM